jgi:hypothetical protein
MSRQVEWVNGETGTSGLSSGDVAIPDFELRRLSQELEEAARACEAADPDASFATACDKWKRALDELKGLRPTCLPGWLAKRSALFALNDLLGAEDPRVCQFALDLAHDVTAVLSGHGAISDTGIRSAGERRQFPFILLRPFWFAGKRVTGSRRSQK